MLSFAAALVFSFWFKEQVRRTAKGLRFFFGTHAAMAEAVTRGEGSKEDAAASRVASCWRSSPPGRHCQGNSGGP